MDDKLLVLYSSKHAGTAEIAEKITEILVSKGLETDLQLVNETVELSRYSAVILGSAVYIGRWRKPAVKFFKKNLDLLAGKKVWLFSSGPTGEGDPQKLLQGWKFPQNIEKEIDVIKPRDIKVFQGRLDTGKMNSFEKWIIRKVKAPTGDFRDWDDITAWAEKIAQEMKDQPA